MLKALIGLLFKELKDDFMIHGGLLLAGDTTYCPKASKTMFGVQKWFNHSGNPDGNSYILGHNWGLVGLVSRFKDRFFLWPLLSRIISGQKNPSHLVCVPNGEIRAMTFYESMQALIFQVESYLPDYPIRIVLDAFFANGSFINPLKEKSIDVVTRWRKDGVGRDPATFYSGRGRPPKYGKKWKLSDLITHFPVQQCQVNIYSKLEIANYVFERRTRQSESNSCKNFD